MNRNHNLNRNQRDPGRPVSGRFVSIWLLWCLLSVQFVSPGWAAPPNVVFIYIDDLGYRDVGFLGSDIYQTPNIDRLADQGLIFTNAYAAAPNCAPSRACLMSGQYSPRHGIYTVNKSDRGKSVLRKLIPTANTTELPASTETLAELFHAAGYVTGHFGKWHLGSTDATGPLAQGFDVNVGGNRTGSPAGGYFSPYQNASLTDGPVGEYLTDRLTAEVHDFIAEHQNRRFFVYLSHYAVHTPIQAKSDVTAKYRAAAKQRNFNAKYAAMIESVDESVGKILDQLQRLQLSSRTMIVFYSDNGGHGKITSLAPLRGAKGMLYEGGIRVPLAIRWPEKIRPQQRTDVPVHGVDFFPTFAQILGQPLPERQPLDGVSLVPLLTGQSDTLSRRNLFWHFPAYLQGENYRGARDAHFRTRPCSVIRRDHWKLIHYFEDDAVELYDLATDVGETQNLASQRDDKAAELLAELREWQSQIKAPIPTELNPEYQDGSK